MLLSTSISSAVRRSRHGTPPVERYANAGDSTSSVGPVTRPGSAAVVPEHSDPRTDGPMTGGERAVLDHWLDLYRDSVMLKIAGLTADELVRRALPPSSLSLLGVVRHLTEVEAYWLRVVLLDEQDVPDYYCTPTSPDGDFDDVDPATAAVDVAAYQQEVSGTRSNASGWDDLDTPVRGLRKGEPVNLRWVLVHLIEEYARHLGHMDVLREAIDGRTGY
jgi:Protein of unknown function (DUF664)